MLQQLQGPKLFIAIGNNPQIKLRLVKNLKISEVPAHRHTPIFLQTPAKSNFSFTIVL